MKYFDWNKEKNKKLKAQRKICFDEIADMLNKNENVLDVIPHPNKKKYPNQKMFIVEVKGYAYLVPYVEDDEKYFLKRIIPSRKVTKKYIIKK